MKLSKYLQLIFLVNLVLLFNCDEDKNRICNPNLDSNCQVDVEQYPTTLFPLNTLERYSLQLEFESLNQIYECSSGLNKYGLTEGTDCLTNLDSNMSVADSATIVVIVKTVLFKNQKFTNVVDTSKLETRRVQKFEYPSLTRWKIVFNPQRYQDYAVWNRKITLWFDTDGEFRISGY